ncbi:Regulator of rDNA transcription protein 15 [Quillaja saponaria]|uniref:Regulator of rDNA transcription protein 15 n=1 Tax=Quillaja saponaria TaxID=32244 RepID=A0AAD7KM98_QUISA|nr:Regulator of rDNA transcription protein 15 [Quillaja saponaria]
MTCCHGAASALDMLPACCHGAASSHDIQPACCQGAASAHDMLPLAPDMLSRCCQGAASAHDMLPRCCQRAAMVLSGVLPLPLTCCQGAVEVLSRCCRGAASAHDMLSRCCQGAASAHDMLPACCWCPRHAARGKTNLSHDGLNPAHVPYWWVNNPTLGEFCFTMIGRADIEGSKSNVAMNAWLPQASYPCGNFSDTSSFKFRRSKGSIGHAFTVRIRTENQNQTSFYPFVPHEISVLVELILGHLRYLLTDVPPQPNSPPDNVFRPDRPETGLGSKKRGDAPPPIHGISKITDPEGPVPSPSPGRHAATRSRRGSSSSSPPTADGFGTGTPVPSPQSQSFSRGYGSILPTSLAYIVPSTRGCSPWRPDAVMSTTGRGRHSVLRIFKGRRGRIGHRATCGALPAAGPYLRLNRFQGGQAVKQKR